MVVTKINLAHMDRIVTEHAHCVERLLNARTEPTCDQRLYVGVDVLSKQTEFLAELLNAQPDQRCRPSGRQVEDAAGFVVVPAYVIGQVRVYRRSLAASSMTVSTTPKKLYD